jgi:hypothetical protein
VISPDGIRRKAMRLYPAVLRSALEERAPEVWPPRHSNVVAAAQTFSSLFPYDVRADRGRSTDPFSERRSGIEALRAESKDRTGRGYTLLFREVSTRREGRQSIVERIRFECREDYLAFLGKNAELDAFLNESAAVVARLPGLAAWIHAEPLSFLRYAGQWNDIASVCEYLVHHPRPSCYPRQMPVAVHTKFVEEHRGILQKVLDVLLPLDAIDTTAATFEDRYGLASPPKLLFRVRFLDPALALSGLTDLMVPAQNLAAIDVPCRTAFIVENLLPFLTFPSVEGAVCLWGGGFAVPALGALSWLTRCRILYWGDLDRAGFGILASLRAVLPRTESMLMDHATYLRYGAYAVAGAAGGAGAAGEAALRLNVLTDEERATLASIESDPARGRLEQERITHAHVVSYLGDLGFRVLG